MFHKYTQEELRSYCRTNIGTLEIWSRRLIHEKMIEAYGKNYIDVQINGNEYLVKNEIRQHIKSMLEKEPERFSRAVDTLFIDHIIYFLCNPKWYKKMFKEVLDYIYPQGNDEARWFLNKLVPIRNALSHSNPISIRQAEQAICYSHDFMDGLKQYYKDKGEEQVWNVPRIVRIRDSFGNVFDNSTDKNILQSIFQIKNEIYCGDTYSIEIEVDASFSRDEYLIKWSIANHNCNEFNNSMKFSIAFDVKDVSERNYISCELISKKEWHKYRNYDNKITIVFTVLPPVK